MFPSVSPESPARYSSTSPCLQTLLLKGHACLTLSVSSSVRLVFSTCVPTVDKSPHEALGYDHALHHNDTSHANDRNTSQSCEYGRTHAYAYASFASFSLLPQSLTASISSRIAF